MQNKFQQPSSSLLLQYFILLIPHLQDQNTSLPSLGAVEQGALVPQR